jgi:hypothetical protein
VEVVALRTDGVAVPPPHGSRNDGAAHLDAGDAGSNSSHDTIAVGEERLVKIDAGVKALADEQVTVVECGSLEAHKDLACTRLRDGVLLEKETEEVISE